MNAKEEAQNLVNEISSKFPLHHHETIDMAIFIVSKLFKATNDEYWLEVHKNISMLR